jgi:hypothetical protein
MNKADFQQAKREKLASLCSGHDECPPNRGYKSRPGWISLSLIFLRPAFHGMGLPIPEAKGRHSRNPEAGRKVTAMVWSPPVAPRWAMERQTKVQLELVRERVMTTDQDIIPGCKSWARVRCRFQPKRWRRT